MWRSGQDRKNCLRKCHRLALVECGKNRRCKPARKNRHHRANRPADGLLWSGFGTACIHLHSRTRVSAWTYTSGGSWRIRFTFPPAKCFYSRARAARETWKNSGNASPEIIFLRGRLWSKFYNAPEERIEDGWYNRYNTWYVEIAARWEQIHFCVYEYLFFRSMFLCFEFKKR